MFLKDKLTDNTPLPSSNNNINNEDKYYINAKNVFFYEN